MIVFLANQSMLAYKKTNENKSEKRFVGVTEKYLKTEESLNTYDEKLSDRN